MIQKSIRGFLWIPLVQDSDNSVPGGQSQPTSPRPHVNDQSNHSDPTVIEAEPAHPSDPPQRSRPTKSKRIVRAEKKIVRKRSIPARKCKMNQNTKHGDMTSTDHSEDKSEDNDASAQSVITENNQDGSINVADSSLHSPDLLSDADHSLSDMLASALRESTPESRVQHQSDMSSELTNVISLESQLVASRLEIERESNENTRLRTIIDLLEEELDGYKKTCKSPKQEIKVLTTKNDNLRRELSHFSGFADPNGQSHNEDISEQLNVAKTKLESLKDHVMNVAFSLINVFEDDDPVPFQPVTSRRSRKSASVEVPAEPPQGNRIPVILNCTTRHPDAMSQTRSYREVLANTTTPSRTATTTARTASPKDTMVIGTSLTRGVGAKLVQGNIPATCFTYTGSEIPHIRSRIKDIIPTHNRPNHIILQCGGNDAETRAAQSVIGQYDSLISEVRRHCPHAHVSIVLFHKSQCALRCRDPMSKIQNTSAANALWPRDWPSRPMSRMMIGQRQSALWMFSQLLGDSKMKRLGIGHTGHAPMGICHCHA